MVYVHLMANHGCPKGLRGKVCANRQMSAGLQTVEEEAVEPDMPIYLPDKLHLCHSMFF